MARRVVFEEGGREMADVSATGWVVRRTDEESRQARYYSVTTAGEERWLADLGDAALRRFDDRRQAEGFAAGRELTDASGRRSGAARSQKAQPVYRYDVLPPDSNSGPVENVDAHLDAVRRGLARLRRDREQESVPPQTAPVSSFPEEPAGDLVGEPNSRSPVRSPGCPCAGDLTVP